MGTHVHDPHAAWPELDDPISWESSRRFLKFVILFALVGATVYFAALQFISPEQRPRAVVVGAMQTLCLVAWLLHSRGQVRSSVWLMSVGVWTYVTVAAIFFGGVSASVVIVYVPVILLNGWLIGDRAAVIAAVLAGVASLAMAIAETAGRLPVAPVTSPLLRWMILAFIFVICATLMASAARSYRSRLNEVRKLTEELAHRTADLDRAQAVAHVGSWMYELATDAMHISPETCRIFGVGVGTTGNLEMFRSRVHPADQAALRHAWTVALADATAFDYEHRILVGGAVRWVRQRAEFECQPDGSPHRAVGTAQDVTERKQAEGALTESRNLLRAVVDTAPTRVFWKDRTSTYLGCNSAFARDAGASSPEDVVGKSDFELTWADQADTYRADDRRVMDTAVPKLSYEEMQTTPDGRRLWLRTSKVPLRNDDGEVIGVVGIYDDVTDRRRIESRLGMAIDVTGVALWELELPGGRLSFDRASVPPLVGLEPDEAPDSLDGWIAHVHPEDREGLQARIALAMTPGDPVFDYEYRIVSRTGGETWLQTRGRVVHRDDNGQPRLAIGTSMNVTPRRRIEEAIRSSEERSRSLASMLRRMCDNVPDMIWAKDLEGRYVFANRALTEGLLNAADTDEPLGKRDTYFAEREQARHRGDPVWHTFGELNPEASTLVPSDGVASTSEVSGYVKGRFITLDVRTSPFHDEYGRVIGTVGSARDITARRQADEALRESESRMAAVFNASPVGIVINRVADGRVIDANDTALRMYGLRRDDIIGRTPPELHIYQSSEQRDEAMRLLSDTKAVDRRLVRLRAASGRVVETEVSVRSVALKGEPCLVTLMLDVTERRRLEEANLQAQKLASLGTLAGGIAHDFNNILQAIQGNAELAIELSETDGPVAESLLEIRKASGRAAELVRRIMAFGRPRETRKDIVDLGNATQEVLKLLRLTLPAEISLRTEFSADTPPVLADAGQIHETLVNLTTNAAHAIGPRAGTITYSLAPVTVDEVRARTIPGLRAGPYARLSVGDTGRGMDATTLERVFDAFFTTKDVGEGVGLGLSMVHGIMRSHDGAITVESEPGQGATFALYFPAAAHPALGPEGLFAGPDGQLPSWRVLLVDDEHSLVTLATKVLSRMGHEVTACTDPREALTLFRARPSEFDVVVTDLSMPHLSGFELTRELLAIRPDLCVVLTTGHVRAEDEHTMDAMGIRAVVRKPYAFDDLGQVIHHLLGGTD